jgi:tetratricopeptide (TPR) repeat protein
MGKKKRRSRETAKKSAPIMEEKSAQHDVIGITSLVKHRAYVALFLFLLSFGVFAPSLRNAFVWDDVEYIQKISYGLNVLSINYRTFYRVADRKGFSHYRPMLFTSFVADHAMWGLSPFGFHLSNIIFYSISTVLFYFFALLVLEEFKVDGKEAIAFISSLFFVFYPTHVESVSFIGARGDLLFSMFFFLAFMFHVLSYRRIWYLVLTAIGFSLSLLSKEVAIAFPLVVLGFDLLSGRFRSRSNIIKYTVYGILVLIYFYLRGGVNTIMPASPREQLYNEILRQSPHGVFGVIEGLRILLSTYLFYIGKLIFPFNLNPFIADLSLSFYYLFSSIIVILVLCVISFISIRKREDITAFSIFWIFITLGPSALVAVFGVAATPLADRFLYLPSAGYCLLIGYLIMELGKRVRFHKIGWVLILLLCVSYLFITVRGQGIWRDNVSLWREASKKSPDHCYPHANYGAALTVAGRSDEAVQQFLVALEPDVKGDDQIRAFTADNLGGLYANKKDYDDAEKWLLKAIDYDSTYGLTYYHMGLLYFIKGNSTDSVSDYRTAEEYLKKGLGLHKNPDGNTHLLLAKVYTQLGEKERAKEEAGRAIKIGLNEQYYKEAQYILNME